MFRDPSKNVSERTGNGRQREDRRLRWVKARGYFPEITLRDGSKFVLWEDGVDLMTPAEAAGHYLPILREMTKHDPEIVHDLADIPERRQAPERKHSDRAETNLREHLMPRIYCIWWKIDFVHLALAICAMGVVIAKTLPADEIDMITVYAIDLLFCSFGVLLWMNLSLIRSDRIKKTDFEKRMRSLRMQGLMDEAIDDFGNSVPMAGGQMRFGEKYLFASHAGDICAYADIRDISIRKGGRRNNSPIMELGLGLKEYRYRCQGWGKKKRIA